MEALVSRPALAAAISLLLVAACHRPGSGPAPITLGGAPAASPAVAAGPALTTLPGFRVERLFQATYGTHGSWVSLTTDPRGRLVIAAQHRKGLFRVTPPAAGQPASATRVEPLPVDVGQAHGLAFLGDSLYVVVSEAKDENGVYRVRDANGDDQFDEVTRLKALQGNGEHGPHGIVAAPDGKSLYLIGGNFAPAPDALARRRPPLPWGDDHLVAPLGDPAGNKRAPLPGGWIARFAPDGSAWELVATGLRNAYDLAFDAHGELFTYDSDMEWDLGTFWYRPPRVCHVPSGAEFGWRISTRPWPAYFADSVPPVVETGPASPTGVTFGHGAKFPARYQRALFALDWTYGVIYAVHLAPRGGSYEATGIEELVAGKALPVTDAVVGKDGALYFITGGRTLASALYRVTYEGPEPTTPAPPLDDPASAKLRGERRRLEAFHGTREAAAIDEAIPRLGHPDRLVRHAARIALEHQPVASWRASALGAAEPRAQIAAAVALARQGGARDRALVAARLAAIPIAKLEPEDRLDLLRAQGLVFARLGPPTKGEARRVVAQLGPIFPSGEPRVDAELSRVLSYLQAPGVVEKTIALMESAPADDARKHAGLAARNAFYGATLTDMAGKGPQRQRMFYAAMLRGVRQGWTPALRRKYFTLINDAAARSRGGNVYAGAWQTIRDDAAAALPPADRERLAGLLGGPALPDVPLPAAKGPGKVWTVNAVLEALDRTPALATGRNLENGRKMYAAAGCVLCHRFGGDGGAAGPDLTGLAGRFALRDLLDAIVNPSAVISDQYEAQTVTKKDGATVAGRLVSQDDKQIVIMTNMFAPQTLTTIPRAEVAGVEPSTVSQMPPGLLDALNQDEVLDLLAFLLGGL